MAIKQIRHNRATNESAALRGYLDFFVYLDEIESLNTKICSNEVTLVNTFDAFKQVAGYISILLILLQSRNRVILIKKGS